MLRTMVVLILLFPLKVWSDSGQKSCLPERTAAHLVWTVNAAENNSLLYQLTNRVQLVGEQSGNFAQFKVRFDPTFDGVSLPYNLYAVLILRDGEPVAWWDYTRSCQGPGLSFFPGREIALPKVNLVGGGAERLQIMVWGKL